jgi:DNA-directed RNA polymerase specialized sigma24 family protein
MTTKEYLQQYRNAEDDINIKLDQIHQFRELATKTTQTLTEDNVQSSGSEDKVSAIVSKIVDMEREVDAEIDRLATIKHNVELTISSVPNISQRKILTLRYINGLRWEEIAVRLSYHYRWVLELHGRALQEIQNTALKCTHNA